MILYRKTDNIPIASSDDQLFGSVNILPLTSRLAEFWQATRRQLQDKNSHDSGSRAASHGSSFNVDTAHRATAANAA